MTLIPQLLLPLTVADGGDLATVEQGDSIDLAQRIAVLAHTPPGHFEQAPDFGLYDQAFLEGGADIAEIERQIARWVPDADVLLTEDLSRMNEAIDILGVRVAAQ